MLTSLFLVLSNWRISQMRGDGFFAVHVCDPLNRYCSHSRSDSLFRTFYPTSNLLRIRIRSRRRIVRRSIQYECSSHDEYSKHQIVCIITFTIIRCGSVLALLSSSLYWCKQLRIRLQMWMQIWMWMQMRKETLIIKSWKINTNIKLKKYI